MNDLADSYEKAGHQEQALALREQLLALRRKVLGPEHPDTLGVMNNVADSYAGAGRQEDALKLREQVLELRRKVLGPEHPDTLGTMNNLADSYAGAGRPDEALKLREEALALSVRARGPRDPFTISVKNNLADSYFVAGRASEAISLLEQVWELKPKGNVALLKLATAQTWFGHDADYEATRSRMVQLAEGTNLAGTAERAAKAYCLRPSTNAALLSNVLDLAQRAVEVGKDSQLLPWYQLALGMAEYRSGQHAAAEKTLTIVEQAAGQSDPTHDILGTARLFHAMSVFRQDRLEEGRKLFSQAEAQMPPFPADERNPLIDGQMPNHDVLICWLAYKEAKALIEGPSAP
jgi:tetratricopeptide (TPR) repeat protein